MSRVLSSSMQLETGMCRNLNPHGAIVKRARAYVQDHLAQPISLDSISRAAYASRRTLGVDLFNGRAAAAVEDFHDLRFAACEVRGAGSRHDDPTMSSRQVTR